VQIHRRRTGSGQKINHALELAVGFTIGFIVTQPQRHTISSGHADQRRSAHLHAADGMCRIFSGTQAHLHGMMRQARLVKDEDALAILDQRRMYYVQFSLP